VGFTCAGADAFVRPAERSEVCQHGTHLAVSAMHCALRAQPRTKASAATRFLVTAILLNGRPYKRVLAKIVNYS
jgi:hypothetical protein